MSSALSHLYVARSLRSQELPVVFAAPPSALWIAAEHAPVACGADACGTSATGPEISKGAAPASAAPQGYELAYLLTPTLYAAAQGQVDALGAAWERGELSAEKAAVAAARWEAVREWARDAGWLDRAADGGASVVGRVTPAEAEALQLPQAPCPLGVLLAMDDAVAQLERGAVAEAVVRKDRVEGDQGDDAATAPLLDDEGATPNVAPPAPPPKAAFPVRYIKPAKATGKSAAKKRERQTGKNRDSRGLW